MPRWARKLVGTFLLLATFGVASCQAFIPSLPWQP
jgi:hypothetical protein